MVKVWIDSTYVEVLLISSCVKVMVNCFSKKQLEKQGFVKTSTIKQTLVRRQMHES